MNQNHKIYVAGHRGLVGSALIRRLEQLGYRKIITRTSRQLDLRDQQLVNHFFQTEKPEYLFLAAAKVGGIYANNRYPGAYIYDNLAIQTNVIHAAYRYGVKKLLFMGSSCIYPRLAPQPLKEEYLLNGPLEPSNEPYAVAKIAGIKMCEAYNRQYGTDFLAVMPANLYGPFDNFDLESSHVLPALLRKMHEAKLAEKEEVVIWGSGKPRREFLHVDDLADACVYLMNYYHSGDLGSLVNIGTGVDLTILELAETIKNIVGYTGKLVFDLGRPDGTPRKLLDLTRINRLGWQARIPLMEGIRLTYEWYKRVRDI
ncbi:MAG: GDP-L-fucose synthase [Bacillota bacterium]